MFQKDMFRGKVIEAGHTMSELADYLGINAATLYRKIDGQSEFKRIEIQLIRQFLGLSSDDVDRIFFAS